ncbi:MAG TPA: permease [Firmicutes bacterium]|jgi:putative transport protein|nr:permease [Bacillota bacterium]HAV19483.1 permease [Bacillota bacterium]
MYDFLVANPLIVIFAIAFIGYALGRISIKGLSLGTAGVLLVALVFGHFGLEVNKIIQDVGLVLFVTSIGFIAGPTFFRNFKSHAIAYVLLGIIIVLIGVITCAAIILITGLGTELAIGLLAGALTTTPGLGVALEATGDSNLVTTGYGLAYPFGVIGVVLFVQLMPRIFKTDMQKEREQFQKVAIQQTIVEKPKKLLSIDPLGLFGFAFAIFLGILLGKITIPLPGGVSFSLGTSGGPLIVGLLFGHFKSMIRVDLSLKKETLVSLRELGLVLFLIGAGTKAGVGFIEVLVDQGVILFVYGAIMTLIPMILGLLIARKVLKLSMFNSLGSICGGMTSTPALGALIQTTKTDDVATAYAATYPIAIAIIVITFQLLALIF